MAWNGGEAPHSCGAGESEVKSPDNDTGRLTQRRAEPNGSAQTARRTVNPPKTPDGEVEPRVVAMGSMWALRSRLRSIPHSGPSRV